jgi:hypothetical protein
VILGRLVGKKIGGVPGDLLGDLGVWVAASLAAIVALGLHRLVSLGHPLVEGGVILGLYGLVFLGVAAALGRDEARALLRGRRP